MKTLSTMATLLALSLPVMAQECASDIVRTAPTYVMCTAPKEQ